MLGGTMTSKERFLTAMQGNYIPAKRTGLPFWDIYFGSQIPLWKAYL